MRTRIPQDKQRPKAAGPGHPDGGRRFERARLRWQQRQLHHLRLRQTQRQQREDLGGIGSPAMSVSDDEAAVASYRGYKARKQHDGNGLQSFPFQLNLSGVSP